MKTKTIYFISLVFFVEMLFILPKSFISSDLGGTILTISTFLFGLIAGFYIIVTTTDYNNLKNILALETAGWISLFNSMNIYDKKSVKKLSLLIDEYIRRAFDYEIIDYARQTSVEFDNVANFVSKVGIKKDKDMLYEKIRETIEKITELRQQLIVLGTRALSFFQWTVLLVLAVLVVTSLYGLRTGEIFFDIVTVLVSSSIVLILFLIRDLDLYIWNEKTFGYYIFQNVFKSIGRLPYYPEESILNRRIHPAEEKYRMGVFTDFPKTLEKKITIVKKNEIKKYEPIFDFWK